MTIADAPAPMTRGNAGIPKVAVVTQIVTPYQVELFDAVCRNAAIDLCVIYLVESGSYRQWQPHYLNHRFIDVAHADAQEERQACQWIEGADASIFGYYRHPAAMRWLQDRARSGNPWCFWGERPGFRIRGELGKLYRQWKLSPLLNSPAPIWGIGQWAIDGYKREFGERRRYFNIPYFSNLDRFGTHQFGAHRRTDGMRRLLFSGSLIHRKGVDLLARAFAELSSTNDRIALDIVGDGPLRNELMRTLAPVSGNVTFHGFRQWDELPAFYAQADILCVPSRYDGWGLVVPEGLAAGLPVLATNRMGAAIDLLHDGINGWSAEAGNYDNLRTALEKALALTGPQLKRMSAAAIESVAHHALADGVRRFEQAVSGTLAVWNAQAIGD
jgi:glycosyltransferase involved in cell wall biosynthesis